MLTVRISGAAALWIATLGPGSAFEVTDTLSVNVLAATMLQCQLVAGANSEDCRLPALVQPELVWRPTPAGAVHLTVGFAAGNGLEPVSPFVLEPWAADFEDSLTDINGRGWDYLLTAYYEHRFILSEETRVTVAGGIIDSTDFIDTNAFANDEYAQFLNSAFVNTELTAPPSYDFGGVAVVEHGRVSVTGVVMSIGTNDDGRPYGYFGGELGIATRLPMGEGHVRLLAAGTTTEFAAADGSGRSEALRMLSLSADQMVAPSVGLFVRAGVQDTAAEVDYGMEFTGGAVAMGDLWSREDDRVGVAYGYLAGGSSDVDHTHAVEVFYKAALGEQVAVTADAQYMFDRNKDGTEVGGFVLGMRGVLQF